MALVVQQFIDNCRDEETHGQKYGISFEDEQPQTVFNVLK